MMLTLCLLVLSFNGAFEYRDPGPWQPFPFTRATVLRELPGGSNPAFIYPVPHLSMGGEYHSSIPDLRGESSEAGGQLNPFLSMRLGLSRFGIDEYREYILSAALCVHGGGWFSAGASFDCCRLTIEAEDGAAGEMSWQGSAGCAFQPFDWLTLAAVGSRLASPFGRDERNRAPVEYGYGLILSPLDGVNAGLNRSESVLGPMTTLDIHCALLERWSISLGYCMNTGESSTGVFMIWRRMLVGYRFRYHPGLGSTHGLGLTLCLRSPSFTPMVHVRRHHDPSSKRDISELSDDEIRRIEVLTGEERERLIVYRRDVGPLTVDSLYQMRLSREKVICLMDMYFGFSDEEDKKRTRGGKGGKGSSSVARARQAVFRGLVELGLSPLNAVELVRMAPYAGPEEMEVRIRALGLDGDKRQKAMTLCASLRH